MVSSFAETTKICEIPELLIRLSGKDDLERYTRVVEMSTQLKTRTLILLGDLSTNYHHFNKVRMENTASRVIKTCHYDRLILNGFHPSYLGIREEIPTNSFEVVRETKLMPLIHPKLEQGHCGAELELFISNTVSLPIFEVINN